ncbi:uncharacterized protein DC041_0004298, partial [Schistosoma bovis]
NLLQENHSLLKKLELKKEMEAAYLDEIEQLRSVITRLQQEKTSISTPRVDDNSLLLYNLEGRVEKSEEKVALLTKELDLAKKREADLLEQLNSFVNKVDSISEIEDRRIRAEQIVIKQGEQINELKLRLRQTETDAKRKLTESVQKLETRYRDRDTNFIDELVAERERLVNENTKLSYQVQHLEELQLDQERGALKISKAFNLEGNSQEGVISNLERRIKQYKRAQEQSTEIISGLRQRLLDSGQIRRKLQNELWHSIDENTSLSEQISELRKQLSDLRSGKASDNLKANNVELKIKQSSPSLTESDKLDVENRDPQKLNSNKAIYCTNPLKETSVELSKPVHRVDRPGAGIQSKDVPQNCNTS